MIKKTTLLALVCAVALAAGVYYFDWKKGNESKPAVDSSKPAFSIQASDIVSFTIAHPAQPGDLPIHFEKRDGTWRIVQPVQTDADQSTADGIVDQLAAARVSQTESGSSDRRKAFGLDPPQASVEFQLANGSKHAILIGDKDFTGESAYTIVDNGQSVSLLPQLLATSATKSLDDLRDRSVLHLDSEQVASFELKNSAGDISASKDKDQWKFATPAGAVAGKEAVDSLLQAVASAKIVSVASETPDSLARYGLTAPAITFTASGGKAAVTTLVVGKKDGTAYFARDLSRPTIFRIDGDIEKKLSANFGDLRDKRVLHVDTGDTQRIQIEDAAGSAVVSRKPDGSDAWTFESPADRRGKPVSSWKVLDPLGTMQAEEVIDHPAQNLLAGLASPGIRVVLTGKDGKQLNLRISKPSGDFVYAQASGDAALYKLKKEVFDQLNLGPADLAAGDAAASPN
jgi:Domain of unknown function (DUF4340)